MTASSVSTTASISFVRYSAACAATSSGISTGSPSRPPSGSRYAFMWSRSTTPFSSCSWPIGISIAYAAVGELGAHRLERREEVGALAVEHVHEDRRGRARAPRSGSRRASSAPRRPPIAFTTRTTPSTTRSAAIASAWKPGSPGASIRLSLRPCHSRWHRPAESDICRLCSSSSQSETVVRLVDRSEPVDGARLEEHRLDERGLARAPVAGDRDVANFPGFVRSHQGAESTE